MSVPHDLQLSDWHHAVISRTDALFNTEAQAWNGIPVHYPLLELGNNNLQLFVLSILLEGIAIQVHRIVHYTYVYSVTVFYFGNWICPCPQMKQDGHTYIAGSNRKSCT
jgi:hypothetical protein